MNAPEIIYSFYLWTKSYSLAMKFHPLPPPPPPKASVPFTHLVAMLDNEVNKHG